MINKISPYYEIEGCKLIKGNSLEILKQIPDNSIDLIFADPPYFLSNGGITCQAGKMVSVDKGEWDKAKDLTMDEFNFDFLKEAQRIIKDTGSIWVSGTFHNMYSIGHCMQKLEMKLLNNITWQKSNPSPNLSCRMFTHSTETIIWARKNEKSKHYFDYEAMKLENNNKQMKDVWTFSTTKSSEKKFGKHPTQKPLELLMRIIRASSKKGDLVLDPFLGSGTTGVACANLERNFIGIDIEKEYLDIAQKRIYDCVSNFQGELI
ncbi:DNA-methyltransferase [Rummeliibacillus sp. JY-2-4R]